MKFAYLCLLVIIATLATTSFAATDHSKLSTKFAQLFTPSGQLTPQLQADICKFDNTSLNHFKGADWTGIDTLQPDHYKYTMTFCGVTSEAACKNHTGSICQYDALKSNVFAESLGSFTAEPAPTFEYLNPEKEDAGYKLTFVNGSECWAGFSPRPRVTVISFTCDPSNTERSFSVLEPDDCKHEIIINNKYVCGPFGNTISGGAIVLIIIFSTALIYTIFGCLICMAKFGKPLGVEACPQKDFWCSLPILFVAGLKFTGGKIAGCFGSKTITSSSGEYDQL